MDDMMYIIAIIVLFVASISGLVMSSMLMAERNARSDVQFGDFDFVKAFKDAGVDKPTAESSILSGGLFDIDSESAHGNGLHITTTDDWEFNVDTSSGFGSFLGGKPHQVSIVSTYTSHAADATEIMKISFEMAVKARKDNPGVLDVHFPVKRSVLPGDIKKGGDVRTFAGAAHCGFDGTNVTKRASVSLGIGGEGIGSFSGLVVFGTGKVIGIEVPDATSLGDVAIIHITAELHFQPEMPPGAIGRCVVM